MNLTSNTPKIFGLLTAIIFLMFTTLITSAQVIGPDYYENVIRVKLEDPASQRVSVSSENGVALSGITSVDRLNRQFNAVTMKRVFSDGGKFKARREAFGLLRWYEIRFQGKAQVAELVSAYASDSNVEIAEPIYKKSFNQSGKDLNFTPNDPQYPNQYNWNNTGQTGGTPGADVSAPEAWNIQTGDPNVIISSHDSGFDTDHPDLVGALWTNPNPDPVMNDLHGYNFANDNNNIYDSDGHGSHTSGTIAARNNNGVGVSGLAGGDGSGNGVRIMVCKVFGDGGVTGGFAESYAYAADHGAVISTNSWGYTAPGSYEQAVLDGIDYFVENAGYDEGGNPVGPIHGGIVLFSAGNSGSDDEWYPGYYESTYAVAGTNHFDRLIVNGVDGSWFGSNFGEWVDISAPGMFIISSVLDGYDTYSGTSMSCPHVAAAAGLVASQYPGLTNDEVMLRVLGTADPIDDLNPGYEGKLGAGRLNAYAALIEDDGQPPEAITDLSITEMGQTTAGLEWTVPPASSPAGGSMNEAPALYDIRYSESPINNDTDFENATQIDNPPIPLAPGETQSYTVTGLIPLTTYYFAIKSQDLFANKSEMSNVASGTTLGAPILSTDPDELVAEVEVNTQLDQTLTLENIGEGTLTWSIPAYEALALLNNPNIQKNTVSRFPSIELAKGEDDTRVGDPVILGAGGPDDYGYTWIDSNEPGGPAFNWYEISDIGTEVSALSGTWDGNTEITLPFNFKIYDEEWSTAYLSVNGWIYFGSSPSSWFTNQSIPNTTAPNNLLAVFWDDLDMRSAGAVYTYHDVDNNLFIVQWDAVPKSFDTGSLLTFQAILTPHGGVTYQYLSMVGDMTSSTVGIENADGSDGLQVAFNTAYVEDELAVKINTPRIEWLDVTPISGSLEPGETVDLTATYDATGLLAGLDYTGDLSISSNDPSKPTHPVPVTMTVTGGDPQIAVSDETVDFGTIIQGTSTSLPFMIYNVGAGAALAVSDIQIDDAAFSVNETTLSIMPGDSAEVTLTFTAADAVTYNGTMTIFSNDATDPNYQVALTGIGGAAPIVGTDPTEFVKTQEAGTVTTETLTIQNTGGSDLLFTLDIKNTGSSLEYSIPPSDGNFLRSNTQKSIGKAPSNGNLIEEVGSPSIELNQLEEATYYGVNYGNATSFVSFQGNLPEELNIIAPYGGANFSNAGDYPLGEDSFVYELDNLGDLRTIDVATGEATLLGNIGTVGDGWTDMATDPTDGTIYISTGNSLAILDVDGLDYTSIGSWGVNFMIGIAIDNEGAMYGYDLETAMLYSINKETAAITAIGSIGFDPNYGQGLTYDTQHDLLIMAAFNNTTFAAELRLVDPTTGNTELIGVLGATIPGGTNQLGWIATPISGTPDWLAANPVEGTVAPGETFDVELTFDATELVGNVDYYADVNVQSNDPVTPVYTVPVTLSTTGTPQIAVNPTTLDFGDVFFGTVKDLVFTVSNEGNAVLNVTDISADNAAYSVDAASFTLLPGNTRDVTVTFAPNGEGNFDASLTVANDDADVTIDLLGEGVPFLSVSVEQFEETVNAGETLTREFTITNEYSSNLPFSIYIQGISATSEAVFFPSNLSNVELLKWFDLNKKEIAHREKVPSTGLDPESSTSGSRGAVSNSFPLAGLLDATGVTAYSMEAWDELIVGYDVGVPEEVTEVADGFSSYAGSFGYGGTNDIYIVDNDNGTFLKYNTADDAFTTIADVSVSGTFTDLETDYTSGKLYACVNDDTGNNNIYEVDKSTGVMTLVATYSSDYLFIAMAVDDMGYMFVHDIINDMILKIDTGTWVLTEVGPTGFNANFAQSMTFDQNTGQLLMAAYNYDEIYGERNELRYVNRSTGETTLIGKFYGDGYGEMGFITTQGAGWLSVNLLEGTLPPGVSLTLQATFDATELYAGEYASAIAIVGDALEGDPTVTIPAYMTVIGEPVLAASEESVSFDSTFVNDVDGPKYVTLSNTGTDYLHISSLESDNDDFLILENGLTSGDTLYTLSPGAAIVLEIYFTPTSVGTIEGTISVESDGGNLAISLMGEGIPAPVMEMSVDSLAHQAYPGQQQTYSVTMSNTGGNPLEYSMVIGNAAPANGGQTIMLLEEGFEGDFLPDGWSSYAQGDAGYEWLQTSTRAYSGSYSAYHNDDFADCDDWLVTPQLSLAANSVLQFYDYTNYASWYEFSAVWISTGSPNPADGDYVLLQEIDDGSAVWTQRVIDLSDYAGSDVYIAFNYAGYFAHEWYIDDVTVSYELNWLNITSPTEGTIEPGASSEITLAVDATGLSGGVYQSGIIISTNDPLHPIEFLPFTLTVVEALTVSAIPYEEDENLYPNEEFTVPITVTSMDDLEVISFQYTLNYDSELLDVVEIITEGTLSEGLVLETNIGVPGAVSVAAAEVAEEASNGVGLFSIEGEGTLMYVKFKAKEALGDSSFSFSEVLFNEGTPSASSIGGNYSIGVLYGDANLDVNVSAYDATIILQNVVGLIELNEVASIAANVSGDASVTAFDAALVLHYVVGLIDEFPVEVGSAIAKSGKDVTGAGVVDINSTNSSKQKNEKATISSVSKASVVLSKAMNNGEADMMNIPFELNDADKVYSISISLKYDEKLINVEDVLAKLPESWVMVYNDDESFVNIAMAGTEPLPSGSLGAIVVEIKDPSEKANVTGEVTINESAPSTIELNVQALPYKYDLSQNYPNPFNPTTTIKYQIPEQAKVSLVVYNQLGQVVKTLVDQEQDAGYYKVRWNGDNNFGSKVASGVYIFRMYTGSFVSVKKMVFLK